MGKKHSNGYGPNGTGAYTNPGNTNNNEGLPLEGLEALIFGVLQAGLAAYRHPTLVMEPRQLRLLVALEELEFPTAPALKPTLVLLALE